MKKILSIVMLCVAVLGIGTTRAQSTSRWGVVAGADISTLKFDQDLFKVDQNVGATLGVMGELMMPGIGFGFDASLLYTQRGAKLHLGERPIWEVQGYGKENCMLHYLEIPIHLKFKFKNLGGFENTLMPMLFVGPEFSFLLAHSGIDAIKYPGGEFGLDMGLGFEILRKFQVNLSYCTGMSYAVKTKLLDDFTAKNTTYKLTFTYLF